MNERFRTGLTLDSSDRGALKQNIEVKRLGNLFLVGSLSSIFLGLLTFVLLLRNAIEFQSPLEEAVSSFLIWMYFPLTMLLVPIALGLAIRIRFGRYEGFWNLWGGSAVFGVVFSVLIWGYALLGMIATIPP